MGPYVARRLVQMVPLLFGISVVLFGVIQLAPGGPEGSLLARAASSTPRSWKPTGTAWAWISRSPFSTCAG